jgi:beta-lactamase regulating signal transducer with metallopeptidase domain
VDTLLRIGLDNAVGATLLAVVAAAVSRLCRRPALCHSLWLLVLLKLLVPPLLPLPLPWPAKLAEPSPVAEGLPAPPEAQPGRVSADAGVEPRPVHPDDLGEPLPEAPAEPACPSVAIPAARPPSASMAWQPAVLALWAAGALAWWTIAALRLERFERLLRYARPAPAALQERAGHLARRLGLRRCPGVWFLPAPVSPMLWALGRSPRLLLPAALWERLGDEQRDALLAHELAHLRRGDPWVRRLELVVLGLYWWHPVAWWARRRLREAEEQCCDAWVLWALPAAGPAYAAALVETVAFLSQARPALPAAASGLGELQCLKRRLTMILRGNPSRSLTWGGLLGVVGLAALVPLWPTWAQPSRAEPPGQSKDVVAPERPAGEKPTGDRAAESPPARGTAKVPPLAPAGPEENLGAARDRQEQIQSLRDEVELLEAQLEAKQAQLKAAKVALDRAHQRLVRLEGFYKNGAVPEATMLQAQQEEATLEAELLVKEAELKEPAVRLKQAQRRLNQLLQKGTEPAAHPPTPDRPGTKSLFDTLYKDFGTVQHGRVLKHVFHLTNTTQEAAHIAAIRTTSACVTSKPTELEVPAGQTGDLLVTLDTGRFTGEKLVTVYVSFDRPRQDEVRLVLRADSRDPSTDVTDEAGLNAARETDTRKRLQDLEKKLDTLLKEMEDLKRQMKPSRKESGTGPAPGDVMVVNQRSFKIPINVDAARRKDIKELILFASDDEGKTWEVVSRLTPDSQAFDFKAGADGLIWFTVAVVDQHGRQMPPDLSAAAPTLKVRVLTTP